MHRSFVKTFLQIAGGLIVSLALFYTVALSLKKETVQTEEKPLVRSEAIQTAPPTPPEQPRKRSEAKPTVSEKLRFNLESASPAIKLLRSEIRPTDAHTLVQKVDFDLSKFIVERQEVKEMVVYEGRDVDQRPEHIYRVMPDVKTGKAKEIVRLMYVINSDGSVGDAYVLESTNPSINEDVIRSVKTWTYSPAVKNGQNVRCWVRQKIIITNAKSAFRMN